MRCKYLLFDNLAPRVHHFYCSISRSLNGFLYFRHQNYEKLGTNKHRELMRTTVLLGPAAMLSMQRIGIYLGYL